ncbi:hypothetical protein DYY65_08050 [Nitrososphaera sp. AFS]|nr:hypothetical protein [Nitrososphaera sp. AFS]
MFKQLTLYVQKVPQILVIGKPIAVVTVSNPNQSEWSRQITRRRTILKVCRFGVAKDTQYVVMLD